MFWKIFVVPTIFILQIVSFSLDSWAMTKDIPTSKASDPFLKAMEKTLFKVKVSSENLLSMRNASTLLISCVDFRLRGETAALLNQELHLLDDYDEISLPGSSLAFVLEDRPHWRQTIEEIIALLKQIHGIKRVIFLDHRQCSAYKLAKGEEALSTHEKETSVHSDVFKQVRAKMKDNFPDLEVYTLLMGFDGIVENIKG